MVVLAQQHRSGVTLKGYQLMFLCFACKSATAVHAEFALIVVQSL